ncbi:hypothetical protein [Paraburkholderia sp. C35]|uniref:hypothetical protein n=1 Tax=Paraburkholderia sp. C35 TaxID=2126993 RepID=UPI0013A58F5C|nr:hypothetical protein [Paraburkholderia sp. C35]
MNQLLSSCASLGECLTAIPDVIWSGMLGSLITVLGVTVTNFGLSRRHREQLRHTADENALKREHDVSEAALNRRMQLRREVYIPAVEAVFSALSQVGAMVDPTVQTAEINRKFSQAVATIGKVNAVAGAHTVSVVGSLMNCMAAMHSELSQVRIAIDQHHSQYLANGDAVTRAVDDQGRWIETQTSMLFEGPPDPAKWQFVCGQIDFKSRQIEHWTQLRDEKFIELLGAQLVGLKAMAAWHTRFNDASIDASIALRTELALQDDDLNELRIAMKKNSEAAQATLLEIIARLEQSSGQR